MTVHEIRKFQRGDVVRVVRGARAGTTGMVSSARANTNFTNGSVVIYPDDRSCIAFFKRPADLRLIGREALTKGGRRTGGREMFE